MDYRTLYKKWKYDKTISDRERKLYYSILHFPTFAETFLWIRNKKRQLQKFSFNPVQKIIYPTLKEHNRSIILKYRQGGISTLIAGYFFWDTILFPHTYTLVIAHLNDSAHKLFEIVKRYYDNLPPELIEFLELETQYNNKTELSFKNKDSLYSVGSTENEYGRGMTINNLHLSEFAFWKPTKADNFPELSEAVPLDGGRLFIESTPNGLNSFYDKYKDAKLGNSDLFPIFIPWYKHPEYVFKPWFTEDDLTPEEIEVKKLFGLTLEQIAWRRKKKAALKELFFQEYPEDDESCFLQSSTNVFNVQILEAIQKSLLANNIKPIREIDIKELIDMPVKGKFELFVMPTVDKSYIIAVDPAGGEKESLRSDPTAIVVIEIGTPNKVVGVFNDKIKPTELSALLLKLGKMFNNAKIVVERNNHGELVLYNLANGFILQGKRYSAYGNLYKESENRLGIRTTTGNKRTIIENLNDGLERGTIEIPSLKIIDEMKHFVEKRSVSGKIILEAQSNSHDDLVMALALGYYAITLNSNNTLSVFSWTTL